MAPSQDDSLGVLVRRLSTILLALATTLALSPVAPARADSTVEVHGFDYPDENAAFLIARNCTDVTTNPGENILLHIIYTDDAPPIGLRAQGFDLEGGNAVGPMAYTPTPSDTVFTMRLRPDGAASGKLVALYVAPGDADGFWFGWASRTESGTSWRTVDGAGAVFEWYRVDNATQTWTPAGNSTLAAFAAAHGGDGNPEEYTGAYLGMLFGCDGNRFYFDGLRVGPPGDVTTYDFEGALTAALIEISRGTITAGQGVLLGGAPDPAVSSYVALEMVLEARRFGQADFVEVGRATSTQDGDLVWAQLTQRPRVRTEYRWVIPDSQSTEGSTSPVRVVKVRTAVTAALADSTLKRGDMLVVKGRTTPQKARVATTLQRNVNGNWRKLATGRTGTNGTYSFAHEVGSKGTWKVRVLVAAASGNLAGTSPARTARVR